MNQGCWLDKQDICAMTCWFCAAQVRPVDRKVCQKVVSWLHSSCKNPVILLGSEVQRFGLRPCLKRLITALDVPFVQTMSSKVQSLSYSFVLISSGGLDRELISVLARSCRRSNAQARFLQSGCLNTATASRVDRVSR